MCSSPFFTQTILALIQTICFVTNKYTLNHGLPISQVLSVHMSSGEAAEMGDILATEADLLGMIMEVTNFHNFIIKQYKHLMNILAFNRTVTL